VFDAELESSMVAPHVQQRIGPREEVSRAAQALSGLARAVLACVVHDQDGDVVRALQFAEVPQQGGHLTGVVLIDAVQAYEGIEHEQARRILRDDLAQPPLVMRPVEAERGRRDEVKRQIDQSAPAVAADPPQARLDHGRRIFGHIEQHRPGVVDVEGAQAGRTARHRGRDLEREPRLAGSCRVPDYAA
jgi:hypothetical protein